MRLIARRLAALCFCVLAMGTARAADLNVVSSGGFAAAYKTLAPVHEQRSGDHLTIAWGPSMGETPNAVPARLARGEKLDVVIMVGYALDKLAAEGKLRPGTATPLARSGIGIVVRHGAPHPDVSTPAALKAALLNAKSVAWSDSASGVYIQNEMLAKMGIADVVRAKGRMIPAEPVGEVVARGDAEIGFQQISELKPIHGIDLIGPVPGDLQQYTVFSAGVVATSSHPAAAAELIRFLASPDARAAIIDSGMEPITAR